MDFLSLLSFDDLDRRDHRHGAFTGGKFGVWCRLDDVQTVVEQTAIERKQSVAADDQVVASKRDSQRRMGCVQDWIAIQIVVEAAAIFPRGQPYIDGEIRLTNTLTLYKFAPAAFAVATLQDVIDRARCPYL